MLKAMIWDFDGVIVDTETVWYHIYRDWLKKDFDYNLDIKDYLCCVGANSQVLFQFLEMQLKQDIDIKFFEKWSSEEFMKRSSRLPVMPGVISSIQKAKELGLKLAIATSAGTKKIKYHLDRLGILEDFTAFATADICKNIKPEPDLFLAAARLLECEPEECIVIEDSENGLLAAQRAGMPCIIVENEITRHCDFQGYYQKMSSLTQLDLLQIVDQFKS